MGESPAAEDWLLRLSRETARGDADTEATTTEAQPEDDEENLKLDTSLNEMMDDAAEEGAQTHVLTGSLVPPTCASVRQRERECGARLSSSR